MPIEAPPFALQCDALPAHADVLSFRGSEWTSRCFRFDVDVELPAALGDATEIAERAVGEPAALSFATDADERVVRGVISSAEMFAVHAQSSRATLRLTLRPRLALLSKSRSYRIFQDKRVGEVVRAVLDAHGLPGEVELETDPIRPYVVQYDETDLAFLERLLAEAGYVYAIDPGDDELRERVVISDGGSPLGALLPPLPLLHDAGLTGAGRSVHTLSVRAAVTPRSTVDRAYDQTRPRHDPRTEAREPDDARGRGQIYRHAGALESRAMGAPSARVTLDQARRRALVVRGKSSHAPIRAGSTISIVDPASPVPEGAYHVVRVDHRGRTSGSGDEGGRQYANDFECTPERGAVPRPRAPSRRFTQAIETATVVGPAAHEIHTDAQGRVRVHFHWDLDGGSDTSSCWIRTTQPWSGDGYGFQFIPRVGMEVVVGFLGGDPDTPIILGTAWNALHPPTYPLPASKTRSGIRSRSTRASAGYSELSFEDRAGHETTFLRAERDLDVEARRNETHRIGGSLTESVTGGHFSIVGQNMLSNVGGTMISNVVGDEKRALGSSSSTTVRGDLDEHVRGRVERRVGGDRVDFVGGAERRTVAGAHETVLRSGSVLRSLGSLTTIVGSVDAPQAAVVHVDGSIHARATRKIEVAGDERVEISCGDSRLTIGPDGIEMSAASIRLRGEDAWIELAGGRARVHADTKVVTTSKKILDVSESASISLGTEAKIAGASIKLGASDDDSATIDAEDGELTTIELVDQAGRPVPRARYRVALADGSTREGLLDDEGRAELRIEGAATITFPDRFGVEGP